MPCFQPLDCRYLCVCAGGGANVLAGLAALGSLSRGESPSSVLPQALGGALLAQSVASALLPGGAALPNGLSLTAGVDLLQQASAGRPLCLLTDVDAGSLLGGGSSAAGTGGTTQPPADLGGLFDEQDGPTLMDRVTARVSDAFEQLM